MNDVDLCEHGFVVRDIQGENRFLCRECDERFPRHPDMMDQETFRPDEAGMYDILAQFRDGLITFSEAIQKTSFSLEEFKETIAKIFPPDVETIEHYTLGQKTVGTPTIINEGPKRTSCPAEIEKIFGDPEISLVELNTMMFDGDIFPDLQEVRHVDEPELQQMTIEVDFIDGSVQKVVIDYILLANHGKWSRRQMMTGRTHRLLPGDINANSLIKSFKPLAFQHAVFKQNKAYIQQIDPLDVMPYPEIKDMVK